MAQSGRIPTVTMLGRRARLRRGLRIFVTRGGIILGICSLASLLAVGADVAIGLPVPWWAIVASIMTLGLLITLFWSVARRGTVLDALREVDGALGLDDRLSNALSFSSSGSDDAFVRLAIEEGESAGKTADASRAIRVAFGNAWVAWPALASAAIALGVLMPRYDLLGSAQSEEVAFESRERADSVREDVLGAQDAIRETLSPEEPDAPLDEASEDALRTLDELAQELESGAVDADEAREEASAALEEASRSIEERAEQAALTQQATEEILEKLQPSQGDTGEQTGEGGDPAEALRESLSKGDLDAAERALDELLKQDEALTAEELAERREALEKLAQDLLDASEEAKDETARDRAQEREALKDWGLDEEKSSELQESGDEESIRESLEDMGFDENAAQEQAERISENEKERRARERASEQTKKLSEDLDRAAKDTQEPKDDPADQGGNEKQDGTEQGDDQQQQNDPSSEKPGEETSPDQNGTEQQETPGETGSQQQPDQQPRQNRTNEEQTQRDGTEGQTQEKQGGDSEQTQGDEIPEESQGEGQKGQQGDQGREGDKPGEGDRAGDPNENAGNAPSESQARPGESSETGEGGSDGIGVLRKRLEEMRKSAKDADRLRGDAKKLREQAQKMVEEMSPEQREKLARWLAAQQREGGATDRPFATEGVDARTEDESRRVAGEVTNPNWEADRSGDAVSERELLEVLREASRGNEKAIEERTVPSKYRNVEEYFRQTIRRVEEQEKKATPPAKTAEDAKPEGG